MTIRDYSATASDNSAIEGIGLSDAMLANALDDAIRAQMADSANFLLDIAKPTNTTGSANIYALSTGGAVAAYEDKIRLTFRANFTNTGACTINIDTLGAKSIKIYGEFGIGDPAKGQIQSGGVYDAVYVSSISAFIVLNPTANKISLQNDGGAYIVVIMGQSNAQGANNGGPNPANPLVKTWDGVAGSWGGSDYTALPWTRSNPDGNGANNNIGLSRAHRLAEDTGREVYIIYSAYGGTSIDAWVSSGTATYAWVDADAKIIAALATPELAGKTVVDEIIWAQGEADYLDTFAEHLANLKLLRNQFRAASWCDWATPIYMTEPSNQHDRYAPSRAISYMCSKVDNQCIAVPTNGLRTSYDPNGDGSVIGAGGDYTHFLGESLWELGYYRIQQSSIVEIEPSLLMQPSDGSAAPNDRQVVATFDALYSWNSRTGGEGLNEAFTGDGTITAFTLLYRNTTITSVTVNGVAMADPADYSVSGQVITFTTAPASGHAIIITYGVTVQVPPAFDTIGWGKACYPDGNYTFAFGYNVRTDNLSNYGMVVGNDIETINGCDMFFASGWQITLDASYSGAIGRGHTVSDDGQTAVGLFSEYIAAEADNVIFQVGIGTSTGARKNALTARASGILEAKNLPTYVNDSAATSGGLTTGQIYMTATGELRIKT